MPRSKPVVEVIDDEVAEIYRGMTEAERLQIAFGMWRSARRMVTSAVRSEHPDWTESQITEEVALRLSHGHG